jgi:tellurite methyltransferase
VVIPDKKGRIVADPTWDEKYNSQDVDFSKEPAFFLKKQIHRLSRGKALDVAMGTGRNSIFLAKHGYEVDGVDFSEVAIEKVNSFAQKDSLPIHPERADLTHYQIAEKNYDLIINFYFLERALFPMMEKGLKKNGMLLFETYTVEQARYGRPRNPDYLLRPNELLKSFHNLYIIYYHERLEQEGDETKAIARMLAQKR